MKGYSWNWVSAAVGGQKLESWGYRGPRKMFDDIFSRLDTIQYTNMTDRRTPADKKDRANAFAHAPL